MKERIWSYISSLSTTVGVEIYLLDEEKYSIRYSILQKVNNSAKFIQGEYHLETLEELTDRVHKDIPIALSISGRGVMTKVVPANTKMNEQDYAINILPNYSPQEFLVQISNNGSHDFVSLARRSDLEKVLNYFEKTDGNVLSLTIGPFAILELWPYLKDKLHEKLILGGHTFLVDEGEVSQYTFSPTLSLGSGIISFAGEELNENLIVAYATGLSLIAGIDFPVVSLESIINRKEEFVFFTVFKRLAIAFLAVSLVVLIVNSLLFIHYSSKTEEKSLVDTETLRKELSRLNNELAGEQELANSIMMPINTNYSSLSEIADLLAASQPESIRLDGLRLFPKNEKLSRSGGKPEFDFGKVIISGLCADGNSLNAWMEKIRDEEFCKRIEIAEYSAVEKKQSIFKLVLTVN